MHHPSASQSGHHLDRRRARLIVVDGGDLRVTVCCWALDTCRVETWRGIIVSRPFYIHTMDYPMHTWPTEAPESKEHLARLDQFFAEAAAAAPDAAFLLTADHGMNHKTRCWDLEKACVQRGAPIRIAISVDRDKYLKHHRGCGGVAWVYCNAPRDVAQ
jgi:hypothetical protein